jgi:hypothetical protein
MKNALRLYVIVNFLSIVTSKRLSFFVTRVFVAALHGFRSVKWVGLRGH